MDKVKTALTLVSIAIIVGPIAGAVFLYRDNLLGLVVPPQVKSLLKAIPVVRSFNHPYQWESHSTIPRLEQEL